MAVQRILHIVGRMDRAGAETMVMNLYRSIDRSRYQFDFATFTTDRCDYDDEIETLGGRILRIPGNDPVRRFLGLWCLLRGGEWRIVHSHTLFSTGMHLLAAKLAGVPVRIAHSHNTADANSSTPAGRGYQRLSRKLLDHVPTDYIACGQAAASYLFPGRTGVTVIPNAIDVQTFLDASDTAVREELGLAPDSLVVIQVGRLQPVKNHAFSLRIAEALRERGHSFRLLLVGTGELEQRIEEEIRARGLEPHVRLLGVREDIPALMKAADVMLMPSLHEGFPVVLVESQASGLPAVVSGAISPEVDLGLGLVEFVDLDASPSLWADRIAAAAARRVLEPAHRLVVLGQCGFSAGANVRRLANLYAGA